MKAGVAFFSLLLVCPVLANADEMAPIALNSLSSAPHGIMGARVLDQQGHLLGQVSRIQTDQDGRPSALAFAATDGKQMVVIGAAAASFDGKTVVADDQQPQIAALDRVRTAAN